ncbi:MAG: S8 family serine peptidase [Gammaproteobacteria bacterium]
MAQQLALDPSVEFAEVDRRVPVQVTTANDPYYANAWHLAKIGAPTAWDTAKGDGVIVAIIDSGVDSTHPDLAGKLVPGWNLYDNNSNTSDVYGHGTEVAGVVGALSNNSLGVTSVAWNTKLMPVRVSMSDGSAYLSTIANGITWAADHGANIANCSFATLTGSSTIQNAANYMRSKGGIVVVAAGNYGTLDSTPNTTAMISVSATDSRDALTSWSSYGPYVDVAAPGAGIGTTTNGGGYAAVSGTSFSSPMTAAVLALEKSANPALSNTQLESILESTAVDLGTPGYDYYFGYGRINAAAAVATVITNTTPVADTTAPTTNIASPTGGTTVSGTVSVKGTSATVTVNVSNLADTTAPTVTILNPIAGSTVSGTVPVKLSSSDNVAVTVLSLTIDGKLLMTSNSGTLSYSWNTRKIAYGTHTISAMAKDAAGNITNKSITVTR